MNDCPQENCPLRKKRGPKPHVKCEHPKMRDPLPDDDEEKRKRAVDRIPAGGGFRVMRRSRKDGD